MVLILIRLFSLQHNVLEQRKVAPSGNALAVRLFPSASLLGIILLVFSIMDGICIVSDAVDSVLVRKKLEEMELRKNHPAMGKGSSSISSILPTTN